MSYYVPQPIAVYSVPELQGFRKGNCAVYENRVLCNGNVLKMTNVMVKRLTDGTTAVVTIVDLEDNDLYTVTVPAQTNFTLDAGVDDYEMLVLGAGNWTIGPSIAPGNYYYRIEAGVNTWYTDAVYFDQVGTAAFPDCSDGWIKLTWSDGRCIVSGTSTDNVTPILAYPDDTHTFFMFLRADLSQPEWEREDDGDEDGFGVFVAHSRRAAKTWKMEGYPVSESVLDALYSSSLFENITIEFPTNPAFQGIQNIEVESNWEQGGCFAIFQYKFTTEYLLKRGCC